MIIFKILQRKYDWCIGPSALNCLDLTFSAWLGTAPGDLEGRVPYPLSASGNKRLCHEIRDVNFIFSFFDVYAVISKLIDQPVCKSCQK
jgi:hypothetical protein